MASPCPLCSSKDTRLIADRVRFNQAADVRRCQECTLIYLDQQSFRLPDDFYEGTYHQTYLTHIEPAAFDPQAYYEKMTRATKPWCDRLNEILKGKAGARVLDFGCSTGHVMTAIRENAGKIFGHELNRQEIEYCRNVHKLDVSDECIDTRFQEGTFDFIIMIFVLEHIADPVGLLRHLKSFLKPDGRFMILVPNVMDPLVQFYRIPAFGQFYFCVEHLFYYSPKTIADVFRQSGLKGRIETMQEYPITNHLNWGYRQKPSDVLDSRKLIPDIPLLAEEMMTEWESFWMGINSQYKKFLEKFGFGDRIWCLAEKDDRTG